MGVFGSSAALLLNAIGGIYLLAVLFMTLYALDKHTHAQILRQLGAKREGL